MGISGGRSRLDGRWRVASLFVALSLAALVPAPARADKGPWPDQGDGRGPLAIRKIEIGHVPTYERASTVTVVFERPVDPAQLGRRDFFVLDISGNRRAKSDIWIYFVGGGKKWFGYSYDPRSESIGHGGFYIKRSSPNSFKIVLPYIETRFERDHGGYRFRVASFSRTGAGCGSGCFDSVPDASWLIHDWTKPYVQYWQVPEFSLPTGHKPGASLRFRVTDQGFSGLAGWRVLARKAGAERWRKAHEGRSTSGVRRLVPIEQGHKVDLRLEARDGAGNRMRSEVVRTVVPYDDSNKTAEATFLGLWSEEQDDSAYLNGTHVSSSPLDTFRFTASARKYCISYRLGEDHGVAYFDVGDESTEVDMSFGPIGATGSTSCLHLDSEEPRTAVVQVAEGTINIDGYWFE